jgi:chemotaxis protein histidine kinase CheA
VLFSFGSGFLVHEVDVIEQGGDEYLQISKGEMYECSLVSVPANSQAVFDVVGQSQKGLTIGISKGILKEDNPNICHDLESCGLIKAKNSTSLSDDNIQYSEDTDTKTKGSEGMQEEEKETQEVEQSEPTNEEPQEPEQTEEKQEEPKEEVDNTPEEEPTPEPEEPKEEVKESEPKEEEEEESTEIVEETTEEPSKPDLQEVIQVLREVDVEKLDEDSLGELIEAILPLADMFYEVVDETLQEMLTEDSDEE